MTAEVGLDDNNDRFSFAAAWCDYDEDGWPELYVANDSGRKNLYKCEGGRFRDIAEEKGLQDIGLGVSAAWFDYDGDGRMDLYVTNMWTAAGQRVSSDRAFGPRRAGVPRSDYRGHTKGNPLYRNRGDGSFGCAGSKEGVEMGRWSWSGDGFDFDLDGTPEILVTAGMITHSPDKDLCSFSWMQVVAPPLMRSLHRTTRPGGTASTSSPARTRAGTATRRTSSTSAKAESVTTSLECRVSTCHWTAGHSLLRTSTATAVRICS